jgi:DNA-directed RNA polymerase subunit RPC12/RpoP
MSIVFFCQSCGSRFNVDPRMAGKAGRCKQCGEKMTVPKREEAAVAAPRPVPAMAGAGSAKGAPGSWVGELDADKISLAPLTIDGMKGIKKPSMFAEDEQEDSSPYALAQPERRGSGRAVSEISGAKILWRRQLGRIERVFRFINQSAYLVSVPFVMGLLLGTAIRSHALANWSAIAVIALNITRLFSGLFNVVVIPFRDGFNFKRLKKPLRRVVEPLLTIGLVALAFAFIPWLSYKDLTATKRSIPGRFRASLETLERKVADEQDKARALEGGTSTKKPSP